MLSYKETRLLQLDILDEYSVLAKTIIGIYELYKEVHSYQMGQMAHDFSSNLEKERVYLQKALREFECSHKLHIHVNHESDRRRAARHLISRFRLMVNQLRGAIIYRTSK